QFPVRLVDSLFVDVKIQQPGLEVQWKSRSVPHRVLEAVTAQIATLVLIGSERVERVAVSSVDRRPCQAKQECVGQGGAHLAPQVTFLSPMRLVDQGDDVAPIVQHALGLPELEDGGVDDLPNVLRQQPLQGDTGLRLHQVWAITSEERARNLRVEIDPVDDDHQRWVPERGMEHDLSSSEKHQQGLTRPLEVPDQSLLRITGYDPFHDQIGPLVLLVPSNYLHPPLLLVCRIYGEVGQQIENDPRL